VGSGALADVAVHQRKIVSLVDAGEDERDHVLARQEELESFHELLDGAILRNAGWPGDCPGQRRRVVVHVLVPPDVGVHIYDLCRQEVRE